MQRASCIYGYVGDDKTIIDIKTGGPSPIDEFVQKNSTTLLRLNVDETHCYVSDLDLYDKVKIIIEKGDTPAALLAVSYWDKVIRLSNFTPGTIERPEIMIPFSIPADHISVVGR